MAMNSNEFREHDGRFALANELHARPFPEIDGPSVAVAVALTSPDATAETRQREFDHLIDLLDRYGAQHPAEGANHYYGSLGRFHVKWERHSEFVTYTFFGPDLGDPPFTYREDFWPEDWAANAPGSLLTASWVQIARVSGTAVIDRFDADYAQLFARESTAVARVLDAAAVVASDFRIDTNGFVRFTVLSDDDVGPRRLGRIVQRLIELETYKAMAMLSLPDARAVGAELARLAPELSDVVQRFASGNGGQDDSLARLLDLSATLETLSARHASRFSAAEAYSAIVAQRIEVLRETRFQGRQTFQEFMMRRFDPAMRTCRSTAGRLAALTGQAARAGDMLRTRTDVARAEQNQAILARMDERAAQQLKLQKTVEGLSVVAVSYYAVNLVVYLLGPVAEPIGIGKTLFTAMVTLPTIAAVWLTIRNIRRLF